MASKGFFLVLEGIDGCGKTTIAKLLAKLLNTLVTKEPTRISVAGKKIHAILRHRQSAPKPTDFQKLYIQDRLEHIKNYIAPALAKNKIVICQRYAMSTFAYGMAFGVSLQAMRHDFLKPDMTFLLDLPARLAMARIASRQKAREYFEKKEKLEKIRKKYLALAKKFDVKIIDARPSPQRIVDKIMDVIKAKEV